MKRLNDYTSRELSAFADDQINDLIDLECAFAGAPLAIPRPIAPEKPAIQPDVNIYDVCGLHFTSKEEAIAVSDLLSRSAVVETNWNWEIGSDFKYISGCKNGECTIGTGKVFSGELYSDMQAELAKYKAAKSLFDSKLSEYGANKKARKRTIEEVWKAVEQARRDTYERQQDREKYNRYLKIADGDKEMALKFFCEALHIAQDAAEAIIAADESDKAHA